MNNVDVDIDDESPPARSKRVATAQRRRHVDGDLDVVMDGIDFSKATAKKASGRISRLFDLGQEHLPARQQMEFKFT